MRKPFYCFPVFREFFPVHSHPSTAILKRRFIVTVLPGKALVVRMLPQTAECQKEGKAATRNRPICLQIRLTLSSILKKAVMPFGKVLLLESQGSKSCYFLSNQDWSLSLPCTGNLGVPYFLCHAGLSRGSAGSGRLEVCLILARKGNTSLTFA